MLNDREFALDELRMLAEVERQMDDERVPWVRISGSSGRASMQPADYLN